MPLLSCFAIDLGQHFGIYWLPPELSFFGPNPRKGSVEALPHKPPGHSALTHNKR